MISDLPELAQRLEQQIASFEKLHTDELKRFQEQLETYQRLQADELQMLRDQLNRFKDEIALIEAQQAEQGVRKPVPAVPGITRRDFLTNTLKTIEPKHG